MEHIRECIQGMSAGGPLQEEMGAGFMYRGECGREGPASAGRTGKGAGLWGTVCGAAAGAAKVLLPSQGGCRNLVWKRNGRAAAGAAAAAAGGA